MPPRSFLLDFPYCLQRGRESMITKDQFAKIIDGLNDDTPLNVVSKLSTEDQIRLVLWLSKRDASLCETEFFVNWVNSIHTEVEVLIP